MTLILASKSPRRKELLAKLNIPFSIKVIDTNEEINPLLPLNKAIEEVALQKGLVVLAENMDSIVISADTIVVLNNIIYGKPKDEKDAFRMLSELSGQTHDVISGVAITSLKQQVCFSVISQVTFYPLSSEEIESYIKTQEPMDKAGAYGIQGFGALLVKEIKGDYYSIMGLPIAPLKRALDIFNKEEVKL